MATEASCKETPDNPARSFTTIYGEVFKGSNAAAYRNQLQVPC